MTAAFSICATATGAADGFFLLAMKRRAVEADALRNHAHLEFALGHGAKVWLAQSTLAVTMPSAKRSFF